jgi:hypothetical protein
MRRRETRERSQKSGYTVIEKKIKKPPKAAISLGTDVDAPWGEKIETSRKDNHQNA